MTCDYVLNLARNSGSILSVTILTMLIDTHCHLDAAEFDADRAFVATETLHLGVSAVVVPAVHRNNFDAVMKLAHNYSHIHYALGIHPMYVNQSHPQNLDALKKYLLQTISSNKPPVAIGEIGLDYFVTTENREQQIHFFTEQLKLAKAFDLPVILHVRRAVDDILKYCRQYKLRGGIAHAFNGSYQQAEEFIKLGFKLGFGGAMTYPRALKIRELATKLPLEAIVLETDSPDIPPVWLKYEQGDIVRNTPLELPKIAEVFAILRGLKLAQVADITTNNARNILPNLMTKTRDLYTPPHALL